MLISIVTVAYNDLENLKRTARSVQQQAFDDFEWIVVDGGSRDGTPAWLEAGVLRLTRWTSERDRGIYDAMNKGLDAAAGDYVLFLNAGDTLAEDDTLAVVAARIGQAAPSRPVLVFGDAWELGEGSERIYRGAREPSRNWRGMFTHHQAMFFLRGAHRYDLDFRLSADYAFVSRYLAAEGPGPVPTLAVATPVCCFQLGGVSQTRRFDALREDFVIRRDVQRLGTPASAVLWALHAVHTLLKRFLPGAAVVARLGRRRQEA
jgi:putative colanic acid biosynthesis glycosyltransferase